MSINACKNIVLIILVGFVIGSCKKTKETTKPNIVYILTDQWRAQALGYAGDPNVKTPNIDEFAEEAVNFANAVSVCPVCTPHRASLLTGRYPTSTGMFLNDLYLPEEELCMAEIFKADGYNTAYLGKWHIDGHGRENNVELERRQGFDYWKALECSHDYNNMPFYENDNPEKKFWEGYSPYALAADANQYMTDHANDENPFLLFISIATPHFPHGSAPQEYKDLYPTEQIILSPNVTQEFEQKAREELQGYYGHCTATDKAIGSILDKIEALNLNENTIVVFTSDHGEMMGSHGVKPLAKQVDWDESIKVPFLIRYPLIAENKGAVVNAPINTPDILPTLLGLSNISIPETIEGENLSELVKSPDPNADRAALVMNPCPFTRESVYAEYRTIRTKQYSYARTTEGANKLFDNIKDPYQMNNLVNMAEYAGLQQELDKKLNAELKKAGDEFKPREYYLQKWNLVLDSTKKCINYWDFNTGNGVMQTPRIN